MVANRHGLFWNSVGNDRLYDADSFSEWLAKFFTTGVFANELQVTSAAGMGVSISAGYVNIKGKVRFFDETTSFTLTPAHTSYPRIDTVVVERNNTNREITLKVVAGALSGSSPRATAPVRNSAIYQLVLAEILIPAGATSISQSNITDKRLDTSVCGIVTGTVEEIDAEQLHAQLNSKFNDWFNGIKGKLGTDIAGNLQTQLSSVTQNVEQISSKVQNIESQNEISAPLLQGLTQSGLEWEKKIGNLEKKTSQSSSIVTLYATSWNSNRVYVVNSPSIKANSKVTISEAPYNGTVPDGNYLAYLEKIKEASIFGFRQEEGKLYLVATGDKPSSNLNIHLLIEGE